MKSRTIRYLIAGLLLIGAPLATAQMTTERFIPIGKSPGVSGKYSYIGEIVAVDPASHTITVRDERGDHRITVNDDTDVWLDKSALRRTNTIGGYADCKVGTRVEVMHTRTDESVARWIKIDASR